MEELKLDETSGEVLDVNQAEEGSGSLRIELDGESHHDWIAHKMKDSVLVKQTRAYTIPKERNRHTNRVVIDLRSSQNSLRPHRAKFQIREGSNQSA